MNSASDHNRKPSDEWLADRHARLSDGLSQFLDLDAGLREISLHDEHHDLGQALDHTLDTEAGLQAILPGATASTPPTQPAANSKSAAIQDLDPLTRIKLRQHPAIPAVLLSNFLVRALEIAAEISRWADPLDPQQRLVVRDLVCDLARDLDLAHDLDLDLDPDRDLVRAFARDHDRDHGLAHARLLALVLARALARTIDLYHDLYHDIDRAFDVNRNLNRARKANRAVTHWVSRAIGIPPVTGLATALLDGTFDDFTQADLTQVDIAGVNLVGIHWSETGTMWPPGVSVDYMKSLSRPVPGQAGVYVITPGTTGKHVLDYQPQH